MNNLVCVKINCYKGFNKTQTLEGIKNAGFHYLEISTSNGNSLGLSQDMSIEELNILKNDFDKNNLKPIAIGGNSYLMDEDTSKILKNIKLARFFNCKYLDTTVFNARNDTGIQTNEEDVINKIKYFIPYLEENDLDFVIELHGNYATGKTLGSIINKINNKHVHINYDTGNAIKHGGLAVEQMLDDFKQNIDLISFMHLKDKLGPLDEWNFPALGSGYVPFKKLFNELENKNNNATLTVEIEFTDKGVNNVEEVDQALIDSANYLKSIGVKI